MKRVFVYQDEKLTASTILDELDLREERNWTPDCVQAFLFFKAYLTARENGELHS